MTTNHEHLREVAEKATPGPWSINRHGAIVGGEFIEYTNGHGQSQLAMACGAHNIGDDERKANAEFIATFNPTTAIALLDELAVLRKENEALRAVVMDILKLADEHRAGGCRIFQVMTDCPLTEAARAAIGDK